MSLNWKIKSIFVLILYIQNTGSLSLNGKWKGYIPSKDKSFDAEVPGGIYSDLEKAGVLQENLAGFNDIENRWVANETIVYVTTVEVHDSFLNSNHVILTFHGLDTFAKIYVNDVEVGKTSNMFIKYNFDIKKQLMTGGNELKVIFESSIKVAEMLYNIQSANYIVPPKCTPKEYNGECHVNHIRKMQASYGWDWGPAFPSMGIWKDVELQAVQNVLVTDITTDVYKRSDSWEVVSIVFFEKYSHTDEQIYVSCSFEELSINNSIIANMNVESTHENLTIKQFIPHRRAELWWPNGYGKQNLYTLTIKMSAGSDITERKMNVGFRTVELVQEPLQKGMSFYFKVNEIPMFAKGSNWIPSSVFPEKLGDEKTIRNLLKSAKDTHMNMLRVWGGGVYESDFFYELADEYGIMIWQDFMFACNMYPTTDLFLNNVKEEIVQNMRRLKHHPSIVLWAGNNENEAALYGNWYGTGKAQIYKDDYVKLYVDTIRADALKIDPTRPFMISSPSNGLYSEEHNYTESNPYSNFYGDVHYYNYLLNGWDINQYPITRFASEYGFQGLPSIWTLMSATKNLSDLKLNSDFMKHRQHLPQGYNFMKVLISKNFFIPQSNDSLRDLIDYIYLSQVTQAVSMKIQTESYRQMKSSFNDLGEGMTMGALYWQLNDVWQAPSWSSIDFKGRWKMLHYYVKDFFSPVIITPRLTRANELLIYVVSDLQNTLSNLSVEIDVYQWQSSKSIDTKYIHNITVEANVSRLIIQYWIDVYLERAGCGTIDIAKENCMIELKLKDANGKQIAPPNYVYPISLKKINLPDDSLEVKIKPGTRSAESSEVNFEIEIKSQKLALFVWLEIGNVVGQFSENGFHILNGQKNIVFKTSEIVTLKDITKNLIIKSLSQIYNPDVQTPDLKVITDKLDFSNRV